MTPRQAQLSKELIKIRNLYRNGELSQMDAGKALDALIDTHGGGSEKLKEKAREGLLVKAPKQHVDQSLKELGDAYEHAGTLWTQGLGELARETGRRSLSDKERENYRVEPGAPVTSKIDLFGVGGNAKKLMQQLETQQQTPDRPGPTQLQGISPSFEAYNAKPQSTNILQDVLGTTPLADLYQKHIGTPYVNPAIDAIKKPIKEALYDYGNQTLEENKADMAKVPPANTVVGQAAQSVPRSFPATALSLGTGAATGGLGYLGGKLAGAGTQAAMQVAGRVGGTSIGLAAAPNQLAAEATDALTRHPLLKEEFANLNDAEAERDVESLKSLVNELVFDEKFLSWAQVLQAGGALPYGGWFTRMAIDSVTEGVEEGLDDTVIVGTVVNEAVKRYLRSRKSPKYNSPDLETNKLDWIKQNEDEVIHAGVVGAVASAPTNAFVTTAERLIGGKAPSEQDRIVNETKRKIAKDPNLLTQGFDPGTGVSPNQQEAKPASEEVRKSPPLTEEHQRLMNRTLNRYNSLPKEDKAALFKEPDVQVLIEDILNKEAVGDPLTPDQLKLARLFRKENKEAQEAALPDAGNVKPPKAGEQPTTDGMPEAKPNEPAKTTDTTSAEQPAKTTDTTSAEQPANQAPPKTEKPTAPKPTTENSPVRKAFDSLTPEQRQEFAKDFNKQDGTPGKKAERILNAKNFDELSKSLQSTVEKQQDRLEKILKAPVKTPEVDQTVTDPDTTVNTTVEESSMPDSSPAVAKSEPPPAPKQESEPKPKPKKAKPETIPEPNVESTELPEGEVKTESPESPPVGEPAPLNKPAPVVPPEAQPVQEEAKVDSPPAVDQEEVSALENPKPDSAQEVEQQSKTPTASNTDALPEVETTPPTSKALDAVEDMPEAQTPVAEPVEDVVAEQPEATDEPEVGPLAEEPTTEDSPLKTEGVYDAMSEEERTKLAEEFNVDGEPTKISKHIIAKPVFKDLPKTVQRQLKKLDVDGKLLERAKRSVTAPDTTVDTTPQGKPLEDASAPVEEMERTPAPEVQETVPDTAQSVPNSDTTITEPTDTSQGLPEGQQIQTASPRTPTPALVSSKPAALPKKVASTSKKYAKLVLLDLDLITSSHDLDGAINDGYAAAGGVQPRDDRTALSADDDLQKMVAEPEAPRFLSNSPDPGVGAPIITTGGAVLSGNNRTRALQYLKQQDMAAFWADYDRNLLEDAEALGFDRAALEQQLESAANDGKRLVMVRQFDEDLEGSVAAKIADMENDPAVSARSDAQKAARISAKLTATDIPALLTEDGIAVTNKSSIDRVRKLLSDEEAKLVFDQNGNLTNAGVRLMTLGLIEHAYGRSVTNRVAMDQVPSSQIKALVQAVPSKLRMDQAVNALESDTLAEMDITEQWMTALPIYTQLDEDNRINSDFSNILDYHTFEDPIIPMLVKAMRNGGRKASIKSMTTRLKTYNNRIADAATPMATEQLNKEDLVREIFASGEEQTTNQGSLFSEVEATEETVPTKAGGGLTVDPNTPRGKAYMNKRMLEVMVDVAREYFPNNVDVQVAATLKEAQAIIGRPDVAFGGVSYTKPDGSQGVILVADVLEAEAQLDGEDFLKRGVEIYYHESVGHAGLKIAAGGPGQFKAYNQKVYNARKKEIDKWHRERYKDTRQYKEGGIVDADWVKASEWLAQNFAEKGLKPPKITDRLTFNLAGRVLRRRGTNAEIRLNYDRIYQNLTKGRKPKLRAIGQDEIPPAEEKRPRPEVKVVRPEKTEAQKAAEALQQQIRQREDQIRQYKDQQKATQSKSGKEYYKRKITAVDKELKSLYEQLDPPTPEADTTTEPAKPKKSETKEPTTKSGESSQQSQEIKDSPYALFSESAPGAFALFSENPADMVTWFSGGGTLEAGLTNVNSIAAVEYDQAIVEVYNDAHGTNYTARDIKAVDPQEIGLLGPDIFHASPVCKNFSKAKTLKGATELDRISAEQVAKVITQSQPPIVTIENVPEYANTALYGMITDALDVAGYNWDLQIHDAADYGSPQSRKRMLVRAVKDGELPPVPEKTGPTDWYELLKDDLEKAPDAPFQTRTRPVNWEVERIDNMIARGSLDPNLPIITMGGSAGKSVANARNSGGPSPTLLASHKQSVRVLYPDGRVKLVTPEMMRKLMGLPDSYPLPKEGRGQFTNAYGYAKTILGNGISGYTSRTFIQPLLDSLNTTGINEPLFSEIPSDKEYMDAVNRGDMEAAQEMVNQAAEAKGYNLDNDYHLSHKAPNSKSDVSLLDLRGSGLLPDDYFTHPQYYTYDLVSRGAHSRIAAALRKVDALRKAGRDVMADSATMWVYRARPKNREESPRNGDWVTPSKEYAKQHMAGEKGWHIQKMRAKLSDLYFDGNDPQELGYDTGENLVYGDTRNNRKRIDPVTYDADGNVIPLSKRFNKREYSTLFSEAPPTRSAEFKEWFGGSVVVNADGTPRRLYRGERSKRTMEPGRGRATLSFTDDPEVANVYSRTIKNAWLNGNNYGKSSNVLPVYISMQNPLDLQSLTEYPTLEDVYSMLNGPSMMDMVDIIDDLIEVGRRVGGKIQRELGVREISTFPEYLAKLSNRFDKEMGKGNEVEADAILGDILAELAFIHTDAFLLGDSSEFIRVAESQGYDGLIHEDVFDAGVRLYEGDSAAIRGGYDADHVITTWRPFKNSQVKSIFNESPSRDNDDLLFSETNQFPEKGVNVRSDKKAGRQYADLIVDGQKTYESRNSDSLRPYVGQRVSIVRTGEGQAQAIGAVTIGEPIVVDESRFRALEDQHMVPAGSDFDIRPGGTKHLYPLKDPVRVNEQAELGRGIVSRKVTTPGNQQGELFSEIEPVLQEMVPLFSEIKKAGAVGRFFDPKADLQGRTEYDYYKQAFRGQQFDAIKLGKFVSDIFFRATRPGEQAALYEYFTNKNADPNQIPDRIIKSKWPTFANTVYTLGTLGIANRKLRKNYGSLRDAAIKAKSRINEHGEALVNLGMLPPDTLDKFGDQYLPKVYLRYLLSPEHRKVITAGGSLKASQMNYLKKRRDTDPVLMAVFGQELKDPAYLAAATIIQQGKDIALMRFLKELLMQSTPTRDDDGNIVESARQDWVLEKALLDVNYADLINQVIQDRGLNLSEDRLPQMARQTKTKRLSPEFIASEANRLNDVVGEIYAKDSTLGQLVEGVAAKLSQMANARRDDIAGYDVQDYAKLPDSPRYGALRGMWVRKEIEQELVNSAGMPNDDDVSAFMRTVTRYWKWMVIAFNQVAWGGNVASNNLNMQVGAGMWTPQVLYYRLKAINELMRMYQGTPSERLQRYEKEGLTLSTFASNELDRIEVNMESRIKIQSQGILRGSGSAIKGGLKTIEEFFADRYQDLELMDKIAIAMFREYKGDSTQEAIRQANEHLFDYTEVPNWIQSGTLGRNSPLGAPFITWMYKFGGWTKNILKRPRTYVRLAIYTATLAAIREEMMADLDDEQEEIFYQGLPEYLQRKGKWFVIPYQERDANGKVIALDLSMFFPFQTLISMGVNLLPNKEGALRDIKNAYSDEKFGYMDTFSDLGLLSSPVIQTPMELLTNRDSFTGKPVYDRYGNEVEQEMALHLIKQFAPYFHMKMTDYLFNLKTPMTTDRMGLPKSTIGVEAARTTGFRTYSVDVDQGRSFAYRRINEAGIRAASEFQAALNRGMTPAEEAKATRQYEAKIKNYERQLKKLKLDKEFDVEAIPM